MQRRWWFLAAAMVALCGWGLYSTSLTRPAVKLPPPAVDEAPAVVEGQLELRAAARAKPESRVLTGRIAAESGRGIPGANVCTTRPADGCCSAAVCTTTDRAGNFAIDADVSGSWLLASADGFLPVHRMVSAAEFDATLVLTLRAGGVRISGNVTDAFGGPIVNAVLSTRPAGDGQGTIGVTDSLGNFSLTVLPGTTLVLAEADGYGGAQRYIDAPEDDVRIVMVAGSSMSGRVVAEDTEEPLAAIDVIVVNESGADRSPRATATDPEGRFRFDALPVGAYSVRALSAGWRSDELRVALGVAEQQSIELYVRPASQMRGLVEVNDVPCPEGTVTIEGPISDHRTLDENGAVEFRGIPPGSYSTLVSCARGVQAREVVDVPLGLATHTWQLEPGITLSGLALTATGAPLAGAQVFVSPLGDPGERTSTFCVSDAQGKFACGGLLPGDYECELRGDSSEISDAVNVRVGGATPPAVLLRAFASGTLRVRIPAESQLQLGALSVVAKGRGSSLLLPSHDGRDFVFNQLALGTYEVEVAPTVPGVSRRVALVRAGEVVEVTLSGLVAGSLSGRVVDESGNGVPDAWVRVAGASPWSQARPTSPVLTDAEGAFTVEGLLQSGHVQVDVGSPRGGAQLADVPVGGRVTVALRTYGSLSGTVSIAGGAPAGVFTVDFRLTGAAAADRVVGYEGAWSLPWLAPGTYDLQVTASEGAAHGTVDVAPGGAASIALSLAPQRAPGP